MAYDGNMNSSWLNSSSTHVYASEISYTDLDIDTGINNLTLDIYTNDYTNLSITGGITYNNATFSPIKNITIRGLNPHTIYSLVVRTCNAVDVCSYNTTAGLTKTYVNITAKVLVSNATINAFTATLNLTYNGSTKLGYKKIVTGGLASFIVGTDIHSNYNINGNTTVTASGYNNTNITFINKNAITENKYNVVFWTGILRIRAKDLSLNNISTFNVTLRNKNYTYNINRRTTTQVLDFAVIPGAYNMTFYGSGYATNLTDYTIGSLGLYNYTFYVFTGESLNFQIYDEQLDSLITWENITLQFIHPSRSFQLSRNNASDFISGLDLGEWKIVYYGPSYDTRYYYIDITNGSYQGVKLYALNSTVSDSLLVEVLDENDVVVSDAVVYLMRYFLTSNSYDLVEMGKTNVEGKVPLWVELYNADYKFMVKPSITGTVWHLGSGQKITSSTYRININRGDSTLSSFWLTASGAYTNLNYSTTAKTFYYTYSSMDGAIKKGCLVVTRETGSTTETICNTCNEAAVTSLLCNIASYENKTGVFYAVGKIDTNSVNSWVNTDSMTFSFINNIGTFGVLGAFIALLIVLLLAFASLWNPYVAIAGGILGLGVAYALGIFWTAGGLIYFMGIVIMGIFILITGKQG
jgi:hypothetical protein